MRLEHVECGVQDPAARDIALTERSQQSLSNIDLPTANRTPAYGFAYLVEVRRAVVSESGWVMVALRSPHILGSATQQPARGTPLG